MGRLEEALRARRDGGGGAFVPYVTGGYPSVDAGLLRRLAAEGAGSIEEAALDVPVVLMTYANPVFRRGLEGFLGDAADAGVAGLIVPDLPVDESADLEEAAAAR